MNARVPLPQRRRNATVDAAFRGQPLSVTVGFDAAGAPREVFANGPREGSDMQHVIADACVVISIALQNGVAPAALMRSLGSVPDWSLGQEGRAPASPIGVILGCVTGAAAPAIGGAP